MSQPIDLAELTMRVARTDEAELDRVVVDALQRVAHAGAAERGYVVLFHDDDTFEVTHEWTAPGVAPHTPALARTTYTDYDYSYQVVRRDEVLAVTDVDALPDEAEPERTSFTSFGVRAVLQVPITLGGDRIGLIGVNHREPVDGWPVEFVDTLRRVGSVIAGVLLRRRSLESRQRVDELVGTVSRQRDELLAQVSHELRTPLHAILGYTELLALETSSPRGREAIDQILRNGRHLLALVEELLAGEPAAPPTTSVDVRPEIDAAVAALGDTATARGITISPTELTRTAVIRTSPGRLRQVLYCLLTGAVHAVEDGTDVVVDTPRPATVRVLLHRPRPGAPPVNPLARALIAGYGHVDVRHGEDGAVEVDVTFGADEPETESDQADNP